MATSTTAVLCLFLFLLPLSINAANFLIVNNCSFTVWAAYAFAVIQAGGGDKLDPSQFLAIKVEGTAGGRIWARTGCSFDGSGQGNCQTGDCGGVLQCQRYGRPPNTFAEFTLNQFQNLDFDISNVDGYNVGIDISPTSGGCRGIRCSANIVGECPAQLRAPGGCNNPCTVFRTAQYCCATGSCGPTNYSRFFKTRCPDAYSYPQDDATSTSTCPPGTDYRVTFCPGLHPTIMHGNDSNIGNDGITANIGNDGITANIGNIKLIVTIRLRR